MPVINVTIIALHFMCERRASAVINTNAVQGELIYILSVLIIFCSRCIECTPETFETIFAFSAATMNDEIHTVKRNTNKAS